MATKTAEHLAKVLYRDDLSRAGDAPVERDGGKAYARWVRAAREAGDRDTARDLEAVDRDDFATAWEALAGARIKINVYREHGTWYGARWIDGEYDGCDELDVADDASAEVALAEARSMPLAVQGDREVCIVD